MTRIGPADTLPRAVTWTVLALCLAPTLLGLAGVDFGSDLQARGLSLSSGQADHEIVDAMFSQLRGAFTHSLLEWSAFSTAIFTVVLAFVYFRIKGDVVTPVLALALFCAACMDAFHTLAAARLIEAVADNRDLIPFTWAICRLFNALILIFGASIFLIFRRAESIRSSWLIAALGSAFAIVAYAVIHYCAVSASLPQTMFPGALVTRPYDVAPLVLYLVGGFFVFRPFARRYPSIFSRALLLSLAPQIATQLHMAFGSTALFDHHFNIAHALKILAYLVPFIGLTSAYVQTYREEKHLVGTLRKTRGKLEAAQSRSRQEAERYADLFENTNDLIQMISMQGRYLYVNRAWREALGYQPGEVESLTIFDIIPPDHQEDCRALLKSLAEGTAQPAVELTFLAKDGRSISVEGDITCRFEAGRAVSTRGIFHNVTERRKAQVELQSAHQELEKSHQRLEARVKERTRELEKLNQKLLQDVESRKRTEAELRGRELVLREHQVSLLNLAHQVADFQNDPAEILKKVTEETAAALAVERASIWRFAKKRYLMRCTDLFEATPNRHSAGLELVREHASRFFRAIEKKRTIEAHISETNPDPQKFPDSYMALHGISSMLHAPVRVGGETVGVVTVAHLGDARRWTQEDQGYLASVADLVALTLVHAEKIRAGEELQQLIDTANAPIFAIDINGRITEWNQMSERVSGYSKNEVLGANALKLLIDDDYYEEVSAVFRDALLGKAVLDYELPGARNKDGQARQVLLNLSIRKSSAGETVGLVAIGQDITEFRQKEAELLQAQKMEAVGQLTGGIAHDFNNLLTVIQGNLKMLAEEIEDSPDQELHELIQDALSAARDGSSLTQSLLAFSREQQLEPRPVAVSELVADFVGLLRRTLGEGVTVTLDLEEGAAAVVDPAQLENALLNLCLNARDAMPGGGSISITTRCLSISPESARAFPEIPRGDWVLVAINDTGTGMSAEVKQHAFEPFFSTKEAGKGSGLGLSMVYGFASQSGGGALIASEVGHGTTVTLYFPRCFEQATGPENKQAAGPLPRGSETILVVEDEARVRRFAVRCLKQLGYQALEAANSTVALEILAQGTLPALIFSDIVMPGGINGRELARLVAERYPACKVALTSGYSRDARGEVPDDDANLGVLGKPYSKEELARRVREVLDGD